MNFKYFNKDSPFRDKGSRVLTEYFNVDGRNHLCYNEISIMSKVRAIQFEGKFKSNFIREKNSILYVSMCAYK